MRPLVDKFGRVHKYLRVSLTDACNLRCSYCMPEDHVPQKQKYMSLAEMDKIVSVLVNACGISKIRLTGGEPTLRSDFSEISRLFQKHKKTVKLGITTNGVLLEKYLPTLVDSGFSLFNISMDTLDRSKFPLISNRSELYWDRAHRGFEACKDLLVAGQISKLKINTVVMNRMNFDEIVDFVLLTKEANIEVRFIELMPFAGNSFSEQLFVGKSEILEKIELEFGQLELFQAGGSLGRTLYKVPSFRGSFGIISSMTDAFCDSCDRLRLTASGSFRNCLFSNDDAEVSFGSEAEIESNVRACIDAKFAAYGGKSGMADLHANASRMRPMVEIGG